jgi:hypothetical protein
MLALGLLRVVLRLLAKGWIRQEAHMANDRNPIRERNPMRDDEDLDRTNEEELVSQADDDDLDDLDEMEDDDEDLEA